jgi:hypothetical protein
MTGKRTLDESPSRETGARTRTQSREPRIPVDLGSNPSAPTWTPCRQGRHGVHLLWALGFERPCHSARRENGMAEATNCRCYLERGRAPAGALPNPQGAGARRAAPCARREIPVLLHRHRKRRNPARFRPEGRLPCVPFTRGATRWSSSFSQCPLKSSPGPQIPATAHLAVRRSLSIIMIHTAQSTPAKPIPGMAAGVDGLLVLSTVIR